MIRFCQLCNSSFLFCFVQPTKGLVLLPIHKFHSNIKPWHINISDLIIPVDKHVSLSQLFIFLLVLWILLLFCLSLFCSCYYSFKIKLNFVLFKCRLLQCFIKIKQKTNIRIKITNSPSLLFVVEWDCLGWSWDDQFHRISHEDGTWQSAGAGVMCSFIGIFGQSRGGPTWSSIICGCLRMGILEVIHSFLAFDLMIAHLNEQTDIGQINVIWIVRLVPEHWYISASDLAVWHDLWYQMRH